jgi:nucleoside-diphosphate-sugar epimerase
MVMRVFVAGGTGVIGRRLVPQLVARGHHVTATTTGPGKLSLLEQLGANGVVMDGLGCGVGRRSGGAARPDAIVHQMTAISVASTGRAPPTIRSSSCAGGCSRSSRAAPATPRGCISTTRRALPSWR